MDEKTIQRIKKLQALEERGVGGEKTTAQKKLAKLLKDNGINSLDELQKEEYEYTIFSYNGKHEIKLLRQCMYKVMGAKSDRTAYKPYGRRQKIGIYCTKAQKIEIELEFEFYRNVFYEELSTFMDAFIQAQKIFPEDAPVGDYDEFNERDMKIAFMATGIERRSRAAMIEESEAGNEKTKTTGSCSGIEFDVMQEFVEGSRLLLTGKAQTLKDFQSGRLLVYILADFVALSEKAVEQDEAAVRGVIANKPTYRETPRGKRITDITVNMIEKIKYWLFQKGKDCKRCCLRCRYYDICRWDVLGNVGLQSEETITLLAIENSKPHKDGLLFRICQYVEFKQRARRENEKL